RRSTSSIARPVISATAPPSARASEGSSASSAGSTRRCSGVGAISSNVPSMSRNSAQRGSSGGGGGKARARLERRSATAQGGPGWTNASALSHDGGVEEHSSGPAVDIEFAHDPAHEPHALALLVGGHREGELKCRRALIGVVRVDNDRLQQFARSAGELRED